jgi:hypothetical protein
MLWLIVIALVLAALAAVVIPALLIQPFKLQTPDRLKLSYALRSWSPIITLIALVASLLVGTLLWRRCRGWWRKALLVLALPPLVLAFWFARQNHFEWMFRPLRSAAFVNLNDADFVSNDEMVLAVELNGDAAAYPVRQVAYHHVVQDVIGGVAIAVTY